jgi:hypothetical protein
MAKVEGLRAVDAAAGSASPHGQGEDDHDDEDEEAATSTRRRRRTNAGGTSHRVLMLKRLGKEVKANLGRPRRPTGHTVRWFCRVQ